MTLTLFILYKIYSALFTKDQYTAKYNSNLKRLPVNPIALENDKNNINNALKDQIQNDAELQAGAQAMKESLFVAIEFKEIAREKNIKLEEYFENTGAAFFFYIKNWGTAPWVESFAAPWVDRNTKNLKDGQVTNLNIEDFGLIPRMKNSEFFQSLFAARAYNKENAKIEVSNTTGDTTNVSNTTGDTTNVSNSTGDSISNVSNNILTKWINPYYTVVDGKPITDIHKIYEHTGSVRKILEDNPWFDEGKIGLNPFSLLSAKLWYSGVMRTFSSANSNTIVTVAEKGMRARIIKTLFIAAAPQIVFIFLAAAKFKPLISIARINNISNDITNSVMGLGLFKNSFFRFVLVTYASFFILHTYFPNVIPFLENYLAFMTISQFLRLNTIWITLFIFYYLIQLYYISTINTSREYAFATLPKLLPGFIKSDLILLYKLAREDKNKIITSTVRILMFYVCIIIIMTLLSLIL